MSDVSEISGFTAGPWDYDGGWQIVRRDNPILRVAFLPSDGGEDSPTGYLIAAAPAAPDMHAEVGRLRAKVEEQAAIIHGMQDGALVRDQGALIDRLRGEKEALSKRAIDATFWANQTGDKLADTRAELDKYKLAHDYWKSTCSCGAVGSEDCTPGGMPSGVQREGRGGGPGPLIHHGEGDPSATPDSIRPDRQDPETIARLRRENDELSQGVAELERRADASYAASEIGDLRARVAELEGARQAQCDDYNRLRREKEVMAAELAQERSSRAAWNKKVGHVLREKEALVEAINRGAQVGLPDFLDWLADRLVNVYSESPNIDFVHSCRDRAKWLRAALRSAAETKGT